jgi:hypothetical protein
MAMASEVEKTLEIPLIDQRWKHLFWGAFWTTVATFLIMRAGMLGLVFGGISLAGGMLGLFRFGRTLLHPAGVIEVKKDELVMPPRICAGKKLTFSTEDLRHVYVLRRSSPLSPRSSPLLVIETNKGNFAYPRDWFAGDGDQKRIATSLNHKLGKLE